VVAFGTFSGATGGFTISRQSLSYTASSRVDDVQEIRNKARALEVYAGQSLNHEAEEQKIEWRFSRPNGFWKKYK
jgi:hypothetical protein